MDRFAGVVGYGENQEIPAGSGKWKDVIVERKLYGNVIKNTKQNQPTDYLNDNLTVSNSISVVADSYATEHFFAIRYVLWQGVRWKVSEVEVQSPRLILRLGSVYNGPTPV